MSKSIQRVLSVATEWFSHRGGLSSLNRELCRQIARAGHEVHCLVPRATSAETEAADEDNVILVAPRAMPGLHDDALMCQPGVLPPGYIPTVIIGHGHVTGPTAMSLANSQFPGVPRAHFVHTAPSEIEWFKSLGPAVDFGSIAEKAEKKEHLERELARSASLVVAIGPRLYQEWSTNLHGIPDAPYVQAMTPGFSCVTATKGPPVGNHCLLLGRAEDDILKGLDIAARAMGIVETKRRIRPDPVLCIRGAARFTGDALRDRLRAVSRAPSLNLRVKEYNSEIETIQREIRSAAVVLMPSRAEGFGLVGLEAIACGVPVLISNRSGLADLLHEMRLTEGIVVETTTDLDADGPVWAEAIEQKLADKSKAFAVAAELRDVFTKARHLELAVTTFLEFLDSLAGGSPPTPPRPPPVVPPPTTPVVPPASSTAEPSTTSSSSPTSEPPSASSVVPDLVSIARTAPNAALLAAFAEFDAAMHSYVSRLDGGSGSGPSFVRTGEKIRLLREAGLLREKEAFDVARLTTMRNRAAHAAARISIEQAVDAVELFRELNAVLRNRFESRSSEREVPVANYIPASARDELSRFTQESAQQWGTLTRDLADHHPARLPDGRWTASYTLFPHPSTLPLRRVLQMLKNTQSEKDWAVWWVPEVQALSPIATSDAIECWMRDPKIHDAAHADYWRVDRQLRHFIRRGYREDAHPETRRKALDFMFPIWIVSEVLRHAERTSRQVSRPKTAVKLRFDWRGLEGRELVPISEDTPYFTRGLTCQVTDPITIEYEAYIADISKDLPRIVSEMTMPLYEKFDLFEMPQEIVESALKELEGS